MPNQRISILAYIICILGAAFYLYEFALQVSISVITNQLMIDLSLNAATLGIVSAFFYYAYTFMQVPAGILHDRYGPHLILTLAILLCSFGALIFSASQNMLHASLGRFLMGLGAACSFTGALILITHWFPIHFFPILSGFVQLMSSVGAIFGALAISIAVDQWHWRMTMFYLAIFGFGLAFVVWVLVKNYPNNTMPSANNHIQHESHLFNFHSVIRESQTWWVAFYSFLVWAPIVAFAALWGIPFLVTAYNMSTQSASLASAAIWIGVGLTAPLIGYISERIQRRCIVLLVCALLGMMGTFFIIYFSVPHFLIYIFLFLLGCGGSGQSLAFSVVRDSTRPRSLGAAIGLNNMATVAGGAILQPIIGFLMQLNTSGFAQNHVPIYSVYNYRMALFLIPLCYLLAAIVSGKLIKETYCVVKF